MMTVGVENAAGERKIQELICPMSVDTRKSLTVIDRH